MATPLRTLSTTLSTTLGAAARWHRPLTYATVGYVLLALVAGAAIVIDDRLLDGAPIWLKPFKFAVSIAVYGVTLAWMISLLGRTRRFGWWMGTVVTAALAVEMVVIVAQVLRGRPSHFNVSTAIDGTLWAVMAVAIIVLWLANLVVAILLLRDRMADRATGWAVRLGIVVALVGMAVAFLMTGPTPEQLATLEADGVSAAVGAHSVGVADGGPGMPVTGWSTTGGDLRVPHFIGLHALQALPLLAFALLLLARRVPRLADDITRLRLVMVGAGAYAGVVGVTTWQAMRGQSLVDPDAVTLAALGALALATAAGTLLALRRVTVSSSPSRPHALGELHGSTRTSRLG